MPPRHEDGVASFCVPIFFHDISLCLVPGTQGHPQPPDSKQRLDLRALVFLKEYPWTPTPSNDATDSSFKTCLESCFLISGCRISEHTCIRSAQLRSLRFKDKLSNNITQAPLKSSDLEGKDHDTTAPSVALGATKEVRAESREHVVASPF